MSTVHTGQREGRESSVEGIMGVASTCSTKRRLEDFGNGDESSLAKIPKRNQITNTFQLEDSTNLEANNSDFLTTSILARTLLTTTTASSSINNTLPTTFSSSTTPSPTTTHHSFPISSPGSLIESCTNSTAKLEFMVQSLSEQPCRPITPFAILPPILDSIEELRSLSSSSDDDELEFNSFLTNNGRSFASSSSACCRSTILSATRTVTILSPIDADEDEDDEWTLLNSVTKFKTSSSDHHHHSSSRTSSASAASLCQTLMSTTINDDSQGITEDENGKSYFNLGASEAMVLARKNSTALGGNNSKADASSSSSNDDASSSSSSCDSISSEDLFNSCEDFDPSDDEEEDDDEDDENAEDERNYKQMRSNILHLSLCKLNMFRTQQCVEPSLHRSVLICNTLRHIEQEIRTEDEIRQDEAFLKSREKLPSFWPRTNHMNHQHHHQHNNNARTTDTQEPLITDKPISHDSPYLSPPNPYHNANESSTPPPLFSSYDYNLLRPSSQQTPFHSVSYDDYSSPLIDLPSNTTSAANPPMITNNMNGPAINPDLNGSSSLSSSSSNTSSLTLFECDSGYGGEDLDLSSYYFGTSISSTSASTSFDFPSTNCTAIVTSSTEASTTTTCPSSLPLTPVGCRNPSSYMFSNSRTSNSPNLKLSSPNSESNGCSAPPASDISDIICSSSNTSCMNTSSFAPPPRNLLTNCHPSSASVEIELCSNRIISNAYNLGQNIDERNSNNSGINHGKLESYNHATTTTIWSSSNITQKASASCPMANLQSFAQQESQCGFESRLTDSFGGLHSHMIMNGSHGHSPHHQHLLPMDSLISSTYSSDS